MKLEELKRIVVKEYDSRNLKSGVRYTALNKIVDFLHRKYGDGTDCFRRNKEELKGVYELEGKDGKDLNGAEKSVFNELYNQFNSENDVTPNKDKAKVCNLTLGNKPKKERDEVYVIGLCDEVLGTKALRQHRFDFLLGDSGSPLPVDAFYKDKNLVVEYCERQHTEAVSFFDRKKTVSGVSRGEQRKIYDERRKIVLPKHGIKLINISYSDFNYDSQKRIIRNYANDIEIVRKKLTD